MKNCVTQQVERMLKAPKREGNWTEIPDSNYRKATRMFCQCCGQRYGRILLNRDGAILHVKQHIHHILSRRWLNSRKLSEHANQNLVSLCGVCHGKVVKFEQALFAGDAYGLVTGYKTMNFPMDLLFDAARHYGLKEFLVFERNYAVAAVVNESGDGKEGEQRKKGDSKGGEGEKGKRRKL